MGWRKVQPPNNVFKEVALGNYPTQPISDCLLSVPSICMSCVQPHNDLMAGLPVTGNFPARVWQFILSSRPFLEISLWQY